MESKKSIFKPGENVNVYDSGHHWYIIASMLCGQWSQLKPSAEFRGAQGFTGFPWIFYSFFWDSKYDMDIFEIHGRLSAN